MWEEDERDITDGKFVNWRDPQSAGTYGSGSGPFFVEMIREEKVVPSCTCGGRGGGLLEDGHSLRCEIRAKEVVATFATVRMNGRLRSFSEDLLETVPEPWNK
jgi:hypothetical protein